MCGARSKAPALNLSKRMAEELAFAFGSHRARARRNEMTLMSAADVLIPSFRVASPGHAAGLHEGEHMDEDLSEAEKFIVDNQLFPAAQSQRGLKNLIRISHQLHQIESAWSVLGHEPILHCTLV
jgi:hypothetical protein